MRRPPILLGAAALLLVLPACNDKPADGATNTKKSGKAATPALVPYASTVPEAKPHTTTRRTTVPTDNQPADTASDSTDVQAIDPMPGDTATSDTRAADDPLCAAAQKIVDVNDSYQALLTKAVKVADDPAALVKVLKKLKLDDMRNAYDDLAAEVPVALRRKVALIRDFTLRHGEELAKVEDLQGLSDLIAATEADPDASKVTKATLAVSKYTETECGIKLSQGR